MTEWAGYDVMIFQFFEAIPELVVMVNTIEGFCVVSEYNTCLKLCVSSWDCAAGLKMQAFKKQRGAMFIVPDPPQLHHLEEDIGS